MLNIPEEIKARFRRDGTLKNIRVSFPNNEYADICNDKLITESVSFKESLSSRADIKIGLCEGSIVSFTAVNIPDITGLTIDVRVEIDASGLDVQGVEAPMDWLAEYGVEQIYAVPYGRFVVSKCQLDGDMKKHKVTAYSVDIAVGEAWPKHIKEKITYPYTDNHNFDLHLFNFIVGISRNAFSADDFSLTPAIIGLNSTGTELGPSMNFDVQRPGVLHQCRICIVATKYAYLNAPNAHLYEDFGANLYYIGGSDIHFKTIYKKIVREVFADLAEEELFSDTDFSAYKNVIWHTIHWHSEHFGQSMNNYYGYLEKGDFFTDPYEIRIPLKLKITIKDRGSSSVLWESDEYEICGENDVDIYKATTDMPDYVIPATPNAIEYAGETRYDYLEFFEKFAPQKHLEACCELYGKFGGMGRDGHFRFYDLSISNLYPSETLIPADDLYPAEEDNQAILEKSVYISAWHEETAFGFGKLICGYNDGDADKQYSEDIGNGKAVYDISQNLIIKANTYQTAALLTAIAGLRTALQKLKFYPAELSLVGLPYVECGDELIVYASDGTITTFCLDRTIKGIQSLRDKVSAKGETSKNSDIVPGVLMEEDVDTPDELEEDEARTPVVDGQLKYNGKVQMPNWLYFDRQKMDISGQTIGQDVDTYTVTFTLKDGFVWYGTRTDEDRDVTWTIEKGDFYLLLSVDKILLNKNVPELVVDIIETTNEITEVAVINTSLATAVFRGDDILVQSHNENSGDTVLSVTGAATENYNGGTIYVPLRCRFTMVVPVPTVAEQLKYTGEEQTPEFDDYDDAIMEMSGDLSGIAVGGYKTTFSLVPGYKWVHSNTSPKTVDWTIEKADMSIVLSANSVTLDASHTSVTLNIISVSGTLFGVFSGNTELAMVSYTEDSITVSSPSGLSGDTAMTISVNESENYKAGYVDIPISCRFTAITGVSGIGYGDVLEAINNDGAEDNYSHEFNAIDVYSRHLVLCCAGNLSTLTWDATCYNDGTQVTLKTFIENANAGIGVKFAVIQAGGANKWMGGQITQSGVSSIATNVAFVIQMNYTFDNVTPVETFEWLSGDSTSTPVEDVSISERGFYMPFFFAQRQSSQSGDAVRVYFSTVKLNNKDIDYTMGWSASSEKFIDFGIAIVPAHAGDVISVSARSQTANGARVIYGVMKLS